MASVRWVADRDRRRARSGLPELLQRAGTLVLGLAILAGLAVVLRGGPPTVQPALPGLSAGAERLAPDELPIAAADKLEDATKAGAAGYRFEIVQTSTMRAKAGGPQIEIPDPTDRYKSLGFADSYALGTLIEAGYVTPDGFWMEMRSGSKDAQTPDVAGGDLHLSALVKDGKTWRNDGEGWYETDTPPGIGLDPRTVSLLPTLLRNAASPVDGGVALRDGATVRRVGATGAVADIPGVIAADGEGFTKLLEPIDFAFDIDGRLVELRVVAQNLNLTEYDLVVETTITLRYDEPPGSLPDPLPAYVAPSNPDAQD